MHRYQELFIGLKGRSSPHGGIESCPALNRSGDCLSDAIPLETWTARVIYMYCSCYMGI